MKNELIEELREHCDNLKMLTGFDDAIVGLSKVHGSDPVLIYDPEKIIDILMEREGWDVETAIDFYEHNIECAYFGPGTPAMLVRLESRPHE
jgi:hypothetical protein